jgi:hypothetical protein
VRLEVRRRLRGFSFLGGPAKFDAMAFFAFLKRLRRTSIRTGRSVVVITATSNPMTPGFTKNDERTIGMISC